MIWKLWRMFEQVAVLSGEAGLVWRTFREGMRPVSWAVSRYGGESSGWTGPRVNRLRFHQIRYHKLFASKGRFKYCYIIMLLHVLKPSLPVTFLHSIPSEHGFTREWWFLILNGGAEDKPLFTKLLTRVRDGIVTSWSEPATWPRGKLYCLLYRLHISLTVHKHKLEKHSWCMIFFF